MANLLYMNTSKCKDMQQVPLQASVTGDGAEQVERDQSKTTALCPMARLQLPLQASISEGGAE